MCRLCIHSNVEQNNNKMQEKCFQFQSYSQNDEQKRMSKRDNQKHTLCYKERKSYLERKDMQK